MKGPFHQPTTWDFSFRGSAKEGPSFIPTSGQHTELTAEGLRHDTVNHQESYVDPTTKAHTPAIERSWLDAKVGILRKKREVPLYSFKATTAGRGSGRMNCTYLLHSWTRLEPHPPNGSLRKFS
jgi:hypothetical protein